MGINKLSLRDEVTGINKWDCMKGRFLYSKGDHHQRELIAYRIEKLLASYLRQEACM